MTSAFNSAATNPLILKLKTVLSLSDEECDAVLALPVKESQIGPRQEIVRAGDRPSRSFAILEGVACAFKITEPGKRQILAFHIAGDIPDLQSLHLAKMDNTISTISACKVAFIPHEALLDLCARHQRIAGALWRETLIYASAFREWMTNIGARPAYNRAAHLLCEFVVRLRAVGLANEHSCTFPLTQGDLGDAMGLSVVHVNRIFKELRGQKLIEFGARELTVLNWDGLKEVGEFDPGYLYLGGAESAAA